MRKILILSFTLLTLSVGLWAMTFDNVKYLDANGVEQTANNVTRIDGGLTTLNAGWYLVAAPDMQTRTLVCEGAVHLILINDAKLTATGNEGQAGIQVSGEGNSLTIYAQSTDPDQMGQLVAEGVSHAAGIGGRDRGDGSNITINGGTITAIGGDEGAGIGGGREGSGSNITINGGDVTASGGAHAVGIGGGEHGSYSSIFVTTTHIVKAGDEVIAPTRTATTDIANDLADKRYVTVQLDLTPYKTAAIDEIDAAIEGVTDEYIIAIAAVAKTNIQSAKTIGVINFVKTLAIAKINAIKEINDAIKDLTLFSAEASYIDFIKSSIQEGNDVNLIQEDKKVGLDYISLHDAKLAAIAAVKHDMGDYAESEAIYNFIGGPAIEGAVDADKVTEAKNAAIAKLEEFSTILGDAATAGYQRAKAELPTDPEGSKGTAVVVAKDNKSVTLINPDKVTYIKVE